MNSTPKKVALIGLGDRVKDTVFPAFQCVRDRLHVEYAFQRSSHKLADFCNKNNIVPLSSVADERLQSVDLISVCVHPSQLVGILAEWRASNLDFSNVTLMLDTPVLNPSGFRSMPIFKVFKQVIVAEDLIADPIHRVAKQIIEENRIGRVKRIELRHSGYRHHAMASLRMLAGGVAPLLITRSPLGVNGNEYSLKFRGGMLAKFIEPRDYRVGSFIIYGEHGTVADFDLGAERSGGKHYYLHYEHGDENSLLIKLNDQILPTIANDDYLINGMREYLSNRKFDRVDLAKIRALIDMLVGFADGQDQLVYTVQDGLFDAWSLNITDKLGFFLNLSAPKVPLLIRYLCQ